MESTNRVTLFFMAYFMRSNKTVSPCQRFRRISPLLYFPLQMKHCLKSPFVEVTIEFAYFGMFVWKILHFI